MKVLLLGDDGRAHALAWKLFNSPLVHELICAPGNGGTGPLVPAADLELADAAGIARWAFDEGVDIIVPAGSRPLHAGLVDEVVSLHIGVCGPSQRSVGLERSRCLAKEFMLRSNLPTAPGRAFTDLATAEKYLATQPLPVMIKADHPDAGEASFDDRYAALEGLRELFNARTLEGANNGVVIEGYLSGSRVVFSAFTDGRTAVPLLPVRLYDRVEEGDAGARARGVGAHTSNSTFARRLTEYLQQKFITPVVAGLARDGMPYWGILGIDCVITASGPRLVGLRSSMREGEAQVVLPRLEDDLLPWVQAMIAQRLHELPAPTWAPVASVGVGLMARGYPHHFPTGGVVRGVEELDEGVLAFHSSTESPGGLRYTSRLGGGSGLSLLGGLGASLPIFGAAAAGAATYTTGGLVITVVAQGATLAGARGRALINAERVTFEGRIFRSDIAAKEFG
ncbi:MAG TPA: phosphoribosylglycinamide synthetase C domain-containing protein [Roseiflexaceae bacterium]|nr:phosphoribosylglycinamide synthetase C domain-containing protein [Roseiflexaceae bacterium]